MTFRPETSGAVVIIQLFIVSELKLIYNPFSNWGCCFNSSRKTRMRAETKGMLRLCGAQQKHGKIWGGCVLCWREKWADMASKQCFLYIFFCQGKKHTHTKIILSAQPPPVNHVPFLLLSLYSAHYNCNRYDYWSLMSSAEMRVLLAALCFTATQPRGFSATKWMIRLPLCLHRLLSPACKSYVKTEDGMLSWKLCIFS